MMAWGCVGVPVMLLRLVLAVAAAVDPLPQTVVTPRLMMLLWLRGEIVNRGHPFFGIYFLLSVLHYTVRR